MDDRELFNRVQRVTADRLARDPDEVRPETMLVADLGAEPIDLLDLAFQLQREFGVSLPGREMFPEPEQDAILAGGGGPAVGVPGIVKEPDFTVQHVVDFVKARLKA